MKKLLSTALGMGLALSCTLAMADDTMTNISAPPESKPAVEAQSNIRFAPDLNAGYLGAGKDFNNQILSRGKFSSRFLYGANFYRAVLVGAEFKSANLADANFNRAEMMGADLRGAKMFGANLTDADLTDARINKSTMLSGAHYNKNTKFPQRFVPEQHGMVKVP